MENNQKYFTQMNNFILLIKISKIHNNWQMPNIKQISFDLNKMMVFYSLGCNLFNKTINFITNYLF